MQRVKEFCDNLDKYSRREGVKFQDLVDKAKSLNKKFFQHLVIFASREINRSDFGGRFAIKSYIILKVTKQVAPEIFKDSLPALTTINSILTAIRNSVIKFEKKYKDKLELLRRRKIAKKDCTQHTLCETTEQCESDCGENWVCFGEKFKRCWSPEEMQLFQNTVEDKIIELAKAEGVDDYTKVSPEKLQFWKNEALKALRKELDDSDDDDLDDAEKYDRFVGKNVILTNWDGTKQKVKIIKNDKQGKKLFVDGGHVLIYTNIGEGRAVTAIEIDDDDSSESSDSEDSENDDPEPDVALTQSKKIREWLRNKYGKDWWKVDADEKKKRKKEARAALSKPKSEKPKPRKPKAEKPKPNKAPRKRKLKPPPSLLDPLRLFYTSLYKENPESSMAIEWLTKHSLYKDGQLVEGIEE